MTDLTPNDLSHMSDEGFNALCPQGHHAPGAEPLSPAAQAVLNAAINTPRESPFEHDIAAALRAAADQVVPEPPAHWRDEWLSELRLGKWTAIHEARTSLLTIATELEGN